MPLDTWIGYRLALRLHDASDDGWQDHAARAPGLAYPGRDSPGLVVPSRLRTVAHGSCRKPHHHGADALAATDRWLAALLDDTGTLRRHRHLSGRPRRPAGH